MCVCARARACAWQVDRVESLPTRSFTSLELQAPTTAASVGGNTHTHTHTHTHTENSAHSKNTHTHTHTSGLKHGLQTDRTEP